MRRLAVGVLVLFPKAWRERYEGEMRALLAEQTIGPRRLIDLARAATDAHLHPGGLSPAAPEQMRNTVGAILCGWIAFVVCGSGFAKLTEDPPFEAAGTAHPLLGDAHLSMVLLAALSLTVVLLGGAWLISEVLREAWRTRRRELVRAVCAPFVVVVLFSAATELLAWLVSSDRIAAHTVGAWIAFLVWFALGLGGATVWGLASGRALRLAHPRTSAVRTGVLGAALLTILLALMTAATALYGIAIAVDAPGLAAEANGPLGLVSTVAALAILVVLMTAITGLAALTSARGLQALHAAD
ncbi:MAG: hypothetical protein M3Z95_00650 [Actinomycetota bacterium]|nr:hypothetical protein [Actinomycetota bacterium]